MSYVSKKMTHLLAAGLLSLTTLTSPIIYAEDAATASATETVAQTAENSQRHVPTPPPAQADKAIVENPYGLGALWKGGDFVARGTLIIMIIMSMGSWYIIISKLLEQNKLNRQFKATQKVFWSASTVEKGIESLETTSAYRYIAQKGMKSTVHHDGALLERIDLNTWITMSIQRAVDKVKSRLTSGLAFLATVGSTAPFIGLFGTVWGIYHALTAIGIAGQASIDKVAGPVGEALIMTAIGLAVAVPAVLGYNWLTRRNKAALENVHEFSDDLHSVLLSGVMTNSVVPTQKSK